MSSEINLRTFIKQASDPSENKVIIKKNGKIKIANQSNGRVSGCFPYFHNKKKEAKQAKFSYEVLKGVVELLETGEINETTEKTVKKASQAIYERYEKKWDKLSENEKETFLDLPNRVSLNAMESSEVQMTEGLHMLNTRVGNAIGIDLDRLLSNQALVIRSPDNSTCAPEIDDKSSIETFAAILSDAFNLTPEMKEELIIASTKKDDGKNFDRFFGNISNHYEEKEIRQLDGITQLLTGVSQSQYLHASTILTQVFKSDQRAKFAPGSHDHALIDFKQDGTIEVRHYFDIMSNNDSQAIFSVDTMAVYDIQEQKWVSNSITFSIDKDAPRKVKRMHARLKKLGY